MSNLKNIPKNINEAFIPLYLNYLTDIRTLLSQDEFGGAVVATYYRIFVLVAEMEMRLQSYLSKNQSKSRKVYLKKIMEEEMQCLLSIMESELKALKNDE